MANQLGEQMNLKQLKEIVSCGETDCVEFKKSTGLLKEVFESVCAFLNSGGGTIFIGVTDTGKIAGQDVSNDTRR
jgi:ATP-dependent DNA helicase RecG